MCAVPPVPWPCAVPSAVVGGCGAVAAVPAVPLCRCTAVPLAPLCIVGPDYPHKKHWDASGVVYVSRSQVWLACTYLRPVSCVLRPGEAEPAAGAWPPQAAYGRMMQACRRMGASARARDVCESARCERQIRGNCVLSCVLQDQQAGSEIEGRAVRRTAVCAGPF